MKSLTETAKLGPLFSFFEQMMLRYIRLHEKKKVSWISHSVSVGTSKNRKYSQNGVFFQNSLSFSLLSILIQQKGKQSTILTYLIF